MRKLPAYPLFVKDPFFSLWADSEILTEQDTVFWHGEPKPLYGQVVAEGKVYGFMGRQQHVTPLTQTALNLKAFSTLYHFTCSDFDLELEFLSPLTPNDLDLASCPVCFLKYTLTFKRPLGSIRITFSAEERLCYNTCFMPDHKENVRGGVLKYDGFESAYFGLRRQSPLSHSSDEIGADWGYYLSWPGLRIL